MDNDPDQILILIVSFFALLSVLLLILDRLESTLDAPRTPLRQHA